MDVACVLVRSFLKDGVYKTTPKYKTQIIPNWLPFNTYFGKAQLLSIHQLLMKNEVI